MSPCLRRLHAFVRHIRPVGAHTVLSVGYDDVGYVYVCQPSVTSRAAICNHYLENVPVCKKVYFTKPFLRFGDSDW